MRADGIRKKLAGCKRLTAGTGKKVAGAGRLAAGAKSFLAEAKKLVAGAGFRFSVESGGAAGTLGGGGCAWPWWGPNRALHARFGM